LSLPQPHEFITAACIILGCYVVVRTRSRLSAIGGMGLIGYGVALMFVYFGAPDLAITQFLIETLSVLLLVLVFWKLPAFRRFSSTGGRLRDGIIASAFGVLMAGLVLVASQSEIGDREVRDYYAATSYEEAHGRNVVNVILVDFRGVDTMGEITVLMIAAVGVFALIRLPGDAQRRAAEDGGTDGPGNSDAAGVAGGEAT
ncbi:MAG: hydrogen gas-evolving membrane-bound hydrogenase subunit E, partial [Planctomycetota bacterium]